MYEARQNKERVSRRIDDANGRAMQKMSINNILIMQKFRAVKVYPYPEAAQKFREQNPNGGNIAYFFDNPEDKYRGNGSVHSEVKMHECE